MADSRGTLRLLSKTESGHLTEALVDDGNNDQILVCAAHGGNIEPGTHEQAFELANKLPNVSCWARLGYDTAVGAFDAWHVPSTDIRPGDHPLLTRIATRGFGLVISLHGCTDDAVLLGGRIPYRYKKGLQKRLENRLSAPVEPVFTGSYAGLHPDNFVNWLGTWGIQIEQGRAVRDRSPGAIVSAVTEWAT